MFPDEIPIGATSGTAAAPCLPNVADTRAPTARKPRSGKPVSVRSLGADAYDPGQPDDRDECRKQHPLDVQFIAGIREHGVLQPITAIRTDGVELRDGQRRAHAARQVDLATIPVSAVFESLPQPALATSDDPRQREVKRWASWLERRIVRRREAITVCTWRFRLSRQSSLLEEAEAQDR